MQIAGGPRPGRRARRHRRADGGGLHLLSHLVIERAQTRRAAADDHERHEVVRQAAGVEIERVNLRYGRTHVLKDVELSIRPGEFFAFLGPSGSGKTTLLRLIAGFGTPETGRILIGGRDATRVPPWARNVGMVFQTYALWPHMTVAQNVAFGLEERRVPRAESDGARDAALDSSGSATWRNGGRRSSRAASSSASRIARTLAIEPEVLLLDEPLSNLDAGLRGSVRRELRELQRGSA